MCDKLQNHNESLKARASGKQKVSKLHHLLLPWGLFWHFESFCLSILSSDLFHQPLHLSIKMMLSRHFWDWLKLAYRMQTLSLSSNRSMELKSATEDDELYEELLWRASPLLLLLISLAPLFFLISLAPLFFLIVVTSLLHFEYILLRHFTSDLSHCVLDSVLAELPPYSTALNLHLPLSLLNTTNPLPLLTSFIAC